MKKAVLNVMLGLMLVGCGANRPVVLAYVAASSGEQGGDHVNLDVYLIEPQTQSVTLVISTEDAVETDPCLDVDRARLAYVSRPIRAGTGSTLYVHKLDPQPSESERTPIYESKGRVLTPAWSNKGDRIAFCERVDGRYQLKLINADGTNLTDLGYGCEPSWSADDRALFFNSRDAIDAPESSLMHRDLATGVVTALSLSGHGFVNLQRGTSIAYTTLPYSRRNEAVWVIDANSRQTRLTEPGLDFRDLDPVFINGGTLVAFTRIDLKTGGRSIYAVERYDEKPVAVPLVDGDGAAYTRGGELSETP